LKERPQLASYWGPVFVLTFTGDFASGMNAMNPNYKIAVGMLAGVAVGALAVQGLHAQAKPPVYYVAEIDVTNPDAYAKEYAPKAQAIIKAAGGRFLAIGGSRATTGQLRAFGRGAAKRVGLQRW